MHPVISEDNLKSMQHKPLQLHMAGSNGFHHSQVQWDFCRFSWKKTHISKNAQDFLDVIINNFKPVTFIALYCCFDKTITRVAPKLMPPILLCWPTTSEADVGDMAVEGEPSHQHFVKFCCRATDGSRGAVWQNGVWHGSAYEAKVCNWIPPCGKNCTLWHSSTLAERLRRPNTGC